MMRRNHIRGSAFQSGAAQADSFSASSLSEDPRAPEGTRSAASGAVGRWRGGLALDSSEEMRGLRATARALGERLERGVEEVESMNAVLEAELQACRGGGTVPSASVAAPSLPLASVFYGQGGLPASVRPRLPVQVQGQQRPPVVVDARRDPRIIPELDRAQNPGFEQQDPLAVPQDSPRRVQQQEPVRFLPPGGEPEP